MSVKDELQALTDKMNQAPEGIQGVDAVFQFDLSGANAVTYQVKYSNGSVEFVEGTPFEAKCTLQLSEENFSKLLNGALNPTSAFMMGKLKVKGDMSMALKLQNILSKYQ